MIRYLEEKMLGQGGGRDRELQAADHEHGKRKRDFGHSADVWHLTPPSLVKSCVVRL